MSWITTTNQLIILVTGLVGLITAGVSTFIAIKNFIKANKGKSAAEIWNLIMEIADTAMKDVEKSQLKGLDKKATVINAVKTSCLSMNVDITPFIDSLGAYIDQSIKFVNDLTKNIKDRKSVV